MDPLRVAIHTTGPGLSGYEADEALVEEFGVIAELPLQSGLVFAVGPGSTEEHVNRLVGAVTSISRAADGVGTELEGQAQGLAGCSRVVYGEARMTPREAFFSDSERVRRSCTLVRCPSHVARWK
jgi:arginine decarboxylase